jgi:hypothetical protein
MDGDGERTKDFGAGNVYVGWRVIVCIACVGVVGVVV